MRTMNATLNRRGAFTLVELIVVIGIILLIAALGAAFAPSVADSQNLTRAVDQLEQWLLTAKMRAKRDGLATGIRFNVTQGNSAGMYSEFQYIQQPEALTGGNIVFVPAGGQPPPGGAMIQNLATGNLYVVGGQCVSASGGVVTFGPTNPVTGLPNVDFTDGKLLAGPSQYLVQAGDFLELRDGGVYLIAGVVTLNTPTPGNALQLGVATSVPGVQFQAVPTPLYANTNPYETSLSITSSTTNYRILRQPRPLIGEPPLQLPNNMVVDTTVIPDTIIPANSASIPPTPWSNVVQGASGYIEILFSPSGAVIGNNAVNGKLLITVRDSTDLSQDINRMGIVAVQTRTGFIGAYSMAPGAGTIGYDPFGLAESGRESGL